jgi:hypothetical protein
MQWTVNEGPGALAGVTADPTLYTVHLLSVDEADNLGSAFTDLWLRTLVDGPSFWQSDWQILLFEFRPEEGIFTAQFTTRTREQDQPGIFKLRSEQIEREFLGLFMSDMELEQAYAHFEQRFWEMLEAAGRAEPVRSALAKLRLQRIIPVCGVLFGSEDYFDLDV